MKIISYNNVDCIHTVTKYDSGYLCLRLIDVLDHSLVCICSIDNIVVKQKEVAIKDYDENEGLLKSLLDADVITKPHRYVKYNNHFVPVTYVK